MSQQPYHHGDLRRSLLKAAVEAINESGPGAISLRDLARRSGVSHAAPQHHFGDKAGLLTAVAREGFELLGQALEAASGDLLEVGVAYVRFAVEHRAHFEIMFSSSLYHADAPEILTARDHTRQVLVANLQQKPGGRKKHAPLAAWSIVHGFATLWLTGVLPPGLGDDPAATARPVLQMLFE